MKILVVEDQSGTLEELSLAIRESVLGETLEYHFSDNPEQELAERNVDTARDYQVSQEVIKANCYDLVFLDHRIPIQYDPLLEKKDIFEYSETLKNLGYSLIPSIKKKNQNVVVIGTSSCHPDELRDFEHPDYVLDKTGAHVSEDLTSILKEIEEKRK
jgi:CheY-like chemotaxis protein